ncbi:hypothetical protein [Accumulibacter sp.]|nr:hypothetical protein [Accumulibacter sp.]
MNVEVYRGGDQQRPAGAVHHGNFDLMFDLILGRQLPLVGTDVEL